MAQFIAGEVLTSANLNAAINGRTLNSQTASEYTLALADAGKIVLLSGSVGQTLTIPSDSSIGFANGVTVGVFANGNASVSIVPEAGVTVNSLSGSGSLAFTSEYATAELVKTGSNNWIVVQGSAPAGGESGFNAFLLAGM